MENKIKLYTLVFSDDIEVNIGPDMISTSPTLQNMFNNSDKCVCNHINSSTFSHIIEFTKNNNKNYIESLPVNTLIDVVYAADYLKISNLLKISSDKMLSIINDNSPKQIRKLSSTEKGINTKNTTNS